MAARKSSTAAIGASMATASCSTGVWRRHQRRQTAQGEVEDERRLELASEVVKGGGGTARV